ELWHRRQARRCAVFPRSLSREARQIAMGVGRGRAALLLQGHRVGLLGPRSAVFFRISRRLCPLSRFGVGRLGRQRGRHRDPGGYPEMADSVQLEIPGGKLLRGQLPQYQPPLGRSGRHWPLWQRASRHAGAADGPPTADLALRARAPDRPLSVAKEPSDASLLSALLGGRRIFRTLRGEAAPPARRVGPCDRQPREIFPNTALHPRQPRTIAVWHPRGTHQTEVWRWYLVHKGAPSEVKDFLRDYYIRYSGPGGMTEQDDMENWNY